MVAVLQLLLAVTIPAVVVWLEPRSRLVRTLSPVVLCYLLGIALGNQPWVAFSQELALGTCNVTVALAIPFLLFSVNLGSWLRLARPTVVSFVIVMFAAMAGATVSHLLLATHFDQSAGIAGMLVGVYVGGTPNMAAVGTGLGVRSETFVLLNAADMVVSFAYLLFLLTVAPRILGRTKDDKRASEGGQSFEPPGSGEAQEVRKRWGFEMVKEVAGAGMLAAAIVGVSLGAGAVVPQSYRDAVIILAITTLAVAASGIRRVRSLDGTQEAGQFLLLVFCVAMGYTTDFVQLFSASPLILVYCGVTVFVAVTLHFVAASFLRIERDTIIITSAAGIFGPHMVGPVCLALKNREVLFSGIASGLVGYAVGNYLGIGVAWMLGG
jgi:uncharacterized membrane protein